MEIKDIWIDLINKLQDEICLALEQADGQASFIEDPWIREEGGGGRTRVLSHGKVFEKAGVNTSVVFGTVTDTMRKQLGIDADKWFACGISLVIHPVSPMVPTVHCNYRMFEMYDAQDALADRWFGGGADLTPYYLFEEDAVHFHQAHKDACDLFSDTYYPVFKKTCDDYFVNTHRNNERRGIGGIFYDHKRADATHGAGFWIDLARSCGKALMQGYLPIVEKRKMQPFTEAHKYWQEIRRGRYVEFNLLHDRGTIFGIKTNGRTESILMSLPPTVRFEYSYTPAPGSEEDKLLQVCLHPVEWLQVTVSEEERNDWARRSNNC